MTDKLRIKQICKQKGVKLAQLAERLGIRRTSLAQSMSRNTFTLGKLHEIADILGVPVWQLFISPEEVEKELHGLRCPKCGCKLKITITEEQ